MLYIRVYREKQVVRHIYVDTTIYALTDIHYKYAIFSIVTRGIFQSSYTWTPQLHAGTREYTYGVVYLLRESLWLDTNTGVHKHAAVRP